MGRIILLFFCSPAPICGATARLWMAACYGRRRGWIRVLTLKILLNGGLYTYPSGGLHTDIEGTLVSAAALPGWRTTRDGFTVDLYAGPVVQDYRLTPYDPGSRLRGFYGGAQVAGDV